MEKEQPSDESERLKSRMRAAWNRLTDEDAALLETDEDAFYDRLHEKQGIGRGEAEKKIRELRAARKDAA